MVCTGFLRVNAEYFLICTMRITYYAVVIEFIFRYATVIHLLAQFE